MATISQPSRTALRRNWFRTLDSSLNRVTRRAAHRGVGPFSVVRHVGRRSGRVYETPVILAEAPGGLMAELTYGPEVDWYRNVVAAGGCDVLFRGRWYRVEGLSEATPEEGFRAFGPPRTMVLRALRRREFVRLTVPGGIRSR